LLTLEYEGPHYLSGTVFVRANTTLVLQEVSAGAPLGQVFYSLDGVRWNEYNGSLMVVAQGEVDLGYFGLDSLGRAGNISTVRLFVDDAAPTIVLTPSAVDGVVSLAEGDVLVLTANDSTGMTAIWFSFDGGATWKRYVEPIEITEDVVISYYGVDVLGNVGSVIETDAHFEKDEGIPSLFIILGIGAVIAMSVAVIYLLKKRNVIK